MNKQFSVESSEELSPRVGTPSERNDTGMSSDAPTEANSKPEVSVQGEPAPGHRSKHQKPDRKQQRRIILESPPENRTESDMFILDELLVNCKALGNLSSNARLRLLRLATLATFEDGGKLFSSGDAATEIFIISTGEVLCDYGDQSYIAREGHSLGELDLSLGEDDARHASRSTKAGPCWDFTATSHSSPVECAVIAQSAWAKVMEEEPTWDVNKVVAFLEDVPIFGSLTQSQLLGLARMTTIIRRSAGSVVYQKSSATAHDLYLIRFGYVRLMRSVTLDTTSRQLINKVASKVTHLRAKLEKGKGYGVVTGKADGPFNVVTRRSTSPGAERPPPPAMKPPVNVQRNGRIVEPVFSVAAPRVLLQGQDDSVNVEVALVTSGQCFGEAARASAAPHAASAVADTAVEVLVMNHQELKTRLGPVAAAQVAFLWLPEKHDASAGPISAYDQRAATRAETHSDDETIRQQLQSSLEWELYKKKLVSNIVSSKASAISALRR